MNRRARPSDDEVPFIPPPCALAQCLLTGGAGLSFGSLTDVAGLGAKHGIALGVFFAVLAMATCTHQPSVGLVGLTAIASVVSSWCGAWLLVRPEDGGGGEQILLLAAMASASTLAAQQLMSTVCAPPPPVRRRWHATPPNLAHSDVP